MFRVLRAWRESGRREPLAAGASERGPLATAVWVAQAQAQAPRAPELPARDLRQLLGWFIRVRWVFAAGLALAVVIGGRLLGLQLPVTRALALAVVICTYNVLLAVYHRYRDDHPTRALGNLEAGLQIGLDLVALTTLVHFMGGPTSPLVCLYLIHAIAAVMVLPRREAWLIGGGIIGLFLVLVALEGEPGLPTGALPELGGPLTFEVILGMTLLVTLGASMVITSTIMNGLRLRERQLREAYASLAESQNQLVQTEKHASLGRLVSGIAHEINNPIQFLQGNMSLLSEAFSDALPLLDAESERRPGYRVARLEYPVFRRKLPVLLQDMAEGTERIGGIVRELRTFARRDEGRMDEVVDLAAVVRASVRLLHNQLKHVRVEEALAPDLPHLRGNLAQLQQLVVNALQNAYQALPGDGSGRIAIRAEKVQDGAEVMLTVEDNGCGIPPEIRARIFDPFFTTKQASGGTGLGLAIIEGIVQGHRGRIQVESEVGKGTSFHFLLPVKGSESA